MPFEPKVFGIGLSKTGTTTLFAALNDLGMRTITYRHMDRLGLDDWRSGAFATDYLKDVDAATDMPVSTYFRELDACYPGSKFILTERPLEPWLASIEKQFCGKPNPKGRFKRDTRMAGYGVSTFNRDRFARIHAEHSQAVRAYFADRPDDLLIQNYFEGDGWDGLCAFLERPVPTKPFPNVKPGFSIGADTATAQTLSFVIPLVHPEGPKVKDYGRVEAILRETLNSLTAQPGRGANCIVVCHRLPQWHAEFASRATFLTVGDHPAFAPGRNHVRVDKGMKYALGTWYALGAHGPDFLMPFDGDDFVDKDLSPIVMDALGQSSARDGVVLTSGYNVLLSPSAVGFGVQGVFKVREFDKTCGSCRVFRSSAFREHLLRFHPGLSDILAQDMVDAKGQLRKDILDLIQHDTDARGQTEESFTRVLGRHINQNALFDLAPLPLALVAKGCGHDNHDGPKGGDIHWQRIQSLRWPGWFIPHFGLAESNGIKPRTSISASIRGLRQIMRHRAGRPSPPGSTREDHAQ